MTLADHVFEIRTAFRADCEVQHRAVCACGWESARVDDRNVAVDAGTEHRRQHESTPAIAPATRR